MRHFALRDRGGALGLAAKLMRTFTAQIEALLFVVNRV
jgi:hypothetical protein